MNILRCAVLQLPNMVVYMYNTFAECHMTMTSCNMAKLDSIAAAQNAAVQTDLRDCEVNSMTLAMDSLANSLREDWSGRRGNTTCSLSCTPELHRSYDIIHWLAQEACRCYALMKAAECKVSYLMFVLHTNMYSPHVKPSQHLHGEKEQHS